MPDEINELQIGLNTNVAGNNDDFIDEAEIIETR